jgi:chromosome segregation ATPase
MDTKVAAAAAQIAAADPHAATLVREATAALTKAYKANEERRAAALAALEEADLADIRAEVEFTHVLPARLMLHQARRTLADAEATVDAARPGLAAADAVAADLQQRLGDLRAVADPPTEIQRAISAAERRLSEVWAARNAPAAQVDAAERDLATARRNVDLAEQALAAAEAMRDGPWWEADVTAVPRHAARTMFDARQRMLAGEDMPKPLLTLYAEVQSQFYRATGMYAKELLPLERRADEAEKLVDRMRSPLLMGLEAK